MSTAISVATSARNQYVPRGRNELHTIFQPHFADFCDQYDEKYGATCTTMHPGHDYFRPFSCKGFYLCPSCSRKRTILFAEHLTNEVLLNLPHRQFVFTKDAFAYK